MFRIFFHKTNFMVKMSLNKKKEINALRLLANKCLKPKLD